MLLFAPVVGLVASDELVQTLLDLLVVGIDFLVDLVQLETVSFDVLLQRYHFVSVKTGIIGKLVVSLFHLGEL